MTRRCLYRACKLMSHADVPRDTRRYLVEEGFFLGLSLVLEEGSTWTR